MKIAEGMSMIETAENAARGSVMDQIAARDVVEKGLPFSFYAAVAKAGDVYTPGTCSPWYYLKRYLSRVASRACIGAFAEGYPTENPEVVVRRAVDAELARLRSETDGERADLGPCDLIDFVWERRRAERVASAWQGHEKSDSLALLEESVRVYCAVGWRTTHPACA